MGTCRPFTLVKERLPASEMACLRKIKTVGSVQNKSCLYLCVWVLNLQENTKLEDYKQE